MSLSLFVRSACFRWVHHASCLTFMTLPAVSFLAIIPLAKLLAVATDEMSMRVGQTLAGLLNATLVRLPSAIMQRKLIFLKG